MHVAFSRHITLQKQQQQQKIIRSNRFKNLKLDLAFSGQN